MAHSAESQAKLSDWREKAKEGTITIEEMKEAIAVLREGRISACFASAGSRAKKEKKPIPIAEELLRMLMNTIHPDDLP